MIASKGMMLTQPRHVPPEFACPDFINSLQMTKASFAFTPQILGDDTGTCLYCRVSLNGWDEDDDPL
jgi:Inhibitor of Apoptosis domain